ncbi:MAG: hypothetical protein ACLQVJ_03870 [Syntrophobacteraceae bacterium]
MKIERHCMLLSIKLISMKITRYNLLSIARSQLKESHIGLTGLSEAIGFIVPRKLDRPKPHIEYFIPFP